MLFSRKNNKHRSCKKILLQEVPSKKSQVSFMELQNTKQLLTKSGLMMKTAKIFSTNQKLILFTVSFVYMCKGCLCGSSRHKRFKKTL